MPLEAHQITAHRCTAAPPAAPPTLVAPIGASSPITFSRSYGSDRRTDVKPPPAEDAYVVHVLLRDTTDTRLLINGHEVCVPFAARGAVFMFHVGTDPIASMQAPFDGVRFSISKAGLDRMAEDRGLERPSGLRRPDFGTVDVVLFHLASSLLPLFEAIPDQMPANQMVLDHIALAVHAHLVQTYGGTAPAGNVQQGGLAPWQIRRAKAYIDAHLAQTPSLQDLARECQISASHFARAFRTSVGRPPHRYLLERRVEAAKTSLAEQTSSLRDIAIDCGFSDQSHLSRVFAKLTGETPGAWRRRHRQ
jgi:AraC family transcriptional regulator